MKLFESHTFQELQCTQVSVPKIARPFGMCWLEFYSFLKLSNRILE